MIPAICNIHAPTFYPERTIHSVRQDLNDMRYGGVQYIRTHTNRQSKHILEWEAKCALHTFRSLTEHYSHTQVDGQPPRSIRILTLYTKVAHNPTTTHLYHPSHHQHHPDIYHQLTTHATHTVNPIDHSIYYNIRIPSHLISSSR